MYDVRPDVILKGCTSTDGRRLVVPPYLEERKDRPFSHPSRLVSDRHILSFPRDGGPSTSPGVTYPVSVENVDETILGYGRLESD